MYRLRTARHVHDPMMLTGARISSCAAWQLLQVSRHVASRRAVAARRSAFSWTVMFAPGPFAFYEPHELRASLPSETSSPLEQH
jgi:hypothetical protein